MVRGACATAVTAALVSLGVGIPLSAAAGSPQDQQRLEFDVASIKRNLGDTPGGGMRSMPDGTEVMVNVTVRQFIGAAYPSESGEYVGLPDWARIGGDRYDVTVKPPAGSTREQRPAMWRAFFHDRMKLAAHAETRDTPIYLLTRLREDGQLGPQLKKSSHDCRAEAAAARAGGPPRPPQSAPTDAEVLERCGGLFGPGRIISGGMPLQALVPSLSGMVGSPVEDRTGLQGDYAFTLTYTRQSPAAAGAAPEPADAPDIFTALREQLGLKLEPSRKPLTTVVIDHIERPTEN